MDVLNYIENDSEYRTVGEGKRLQDPNTGNIPHSQEHIQITEYIKSLNEAEKAKINDLLVSRLEELKKELDAFMTCSNSFRQGTVEFKRLFQVQVSIGSQLYIINNELLPLVQVETRTAEDKGNERNNDVHTLR